MNTHSVNTTRLKTQVALLAVIPVEKRGDRIRSGRPKRQLPWRNTYHRGPLSQDPRITAMMVGSRTSSEYDSKRAPCRSSQES